MKTKLCRLSALLLCFALLLGLACSGIPASATVTQEEIDALEAQRDEIRDRQAGVQEQLSSLRSDRDSILARKAALDEQNDLLRQDIALLDEQIALYDTLVREKSAAVEQARLEEDNQFANYRQRVRAMEESNTWTYLAFLLDAASLTDLLSRLDDVSDILTHDQNLRADYVAATERAEAVEAEYAALLQERMDRQAELTAQQAQLEEQIAAAARLVQQLEDDIDYYAAFYEEVEAEKAAIEAEIDAKAAALKKQQEEEERRRQEEVARRRQQQQPAASAGTGSTYVSKGYYAWPANTTYITSNFGYRIHPITGVSRLHSGVDIGAGYGTPITAAAAGTVITAVVNYGTTGYGTYVAIYHSNGTTTLYGHMSSLAVYEGQSVSQGDVIGYVGSTGASTGPHLHFEVRIDGACVDPMQFFG